jgi:hypothetical protein
MSSVEIGTGLDSVKVEAGVAFHEKANWKFDWFREAWHEDAVQYAARKLQKEGISHIVVPGELKKTGRINKALSALRDRPIFEAIRVPKFLPVTEGVSSEYLRKIIGEPEECVESPGNLLLNEGIQEMEDLLIAAGGTTAYNNANAEIGVGDSNAAEAATQTDLQAATNKLYKGMNATFPSRASQTVTFVSDFLTGEANYAWLEASIRNGVTRNKNLNRKQQNLGTKVSGTWTLTGTLVIA